MGYPIPIRFTQTHKQIDRDRYRGSLNLDRLKVSS